MFSRTLRQASKLRTATVPLPLAPGPGIVPPQARPLQTGQARQGPIWPWAACKTSLYVIWILPPVLRADAGIGPYKNRVIMLRAHYSAFCPLPQGR